VASQGVAKDVQRVAEGREFVRDGSQAFNRSKFEWAEQAPCSLLVCFLSPVPSCSFVSLSF
jgi:hypothetical protein